MTRPTTTRDLLPSERSFVSAMQDLGFGRFESIQIRAGELMLVPWPTTIRGVKFSSGDAPAPRTLPDEFQLKRQVVEFLEYVRAVDEGGIRCLEVRYGLPWTMEVEHRPEPNGGQCDV